jgi:acetylornithine deacetylase
VCDTNRIKTFISNTMRLFTQQAFTLATSLSAGFLHIPGTAASAVGPVHARQLAQLAPRAPKSQEFLVELHKSLLDIESITGNEFDVSTFLANFLEEQGWTVELQEVAPRRSNVLAYPPGVESGKSRVLVTTHIDTVCSRLLL